jgi:hypothetical protein
MTLLHGFVLHEAEDLVASFQSTQHTFVTQHVFFFLGVKGLRLLL